MAAVSFEALDAAARIVAGTWRNRGVVSYSYEDMYQDAVDVALSVAHKYDEDKGTLEGFLVSCAMRTVQNRLTRAMHPAGTRSNEELPRLGKLKAIEVHDDHLGEDPTDYDHLLFITQVRARMNEVAAQDSDGERTLPIALGLTTVVEEAKDKAEAAKLYQAVRRLRGKLLADYKLYKIAKEPV